MKIVHKLILIAILPAILIWVVGYYAIRSSQTSLRSAIERTSAAHAKSVMNEIDRVLHSRLADWTAYGRSPLLQKSLKTSNEDFDCKPDLEDYIDKQDKDWQQTTKGLSPFMQDLMKNELSRDLRVRLNRLAQENGYAIFGEVFVTNQFGANIALTNRTSDYRQDDEAWWQRAKKDQLYVGDVKLDESTQTYSTEFCIRIDDNKNNFLGVMKVVFNIKEVVEIIERRASDLSKSGAQGLKLFTSDLKIIHDSSTKQNILADGSAFFKGIILDKTDAVITTDRDDQITGKPLLSTYAKSKGHGDFKGLGWVTLLDYSAEEVFHPIHDLRFKLLLISILATVLALGVSGFIATSLTRRLRSLSKATAAFGQGDLGQRVFIKGKDELSGLGENYNIMATTIANDIDIRKKTTQELMEARLAADAANQAKSNFLSSMSHELRTPLNGVLGYAQILKREKNLSKEHQVSLNAIENCGQHLLTLINDVLDFSKIEAGQMDLHPEPTDLHQLIQSVYDIVVQRATNKGLALNLEVSPILPQGILVDATKLRQILINLLGNAVKFTSKGSITFKILEEPTDHITFIVKDTGMGISKDKTKAIFDPFKQDQGGISEGGTGLGLSISKKLVDLMGGNLLVESELNAGSSFSFALPFEEVDINELKASSTYADENDFYLPEGTSLEALVVDDREANRDILIKTLNQAGCTTVSANNGKEGLEAAKDKNFRIIFMDIRMPVMDGMEATYLIRKENQSPRPIIIAVTASVFPDVRQSCLECGFDDVIGKPYRTSEIFEKMNQHLNISFVTRAQGEQSSQKAEDLPQEAELNTANAEELIEKLKSAADMGDIATLEKLAEELKHYGCTDLAIELNALVASFEFDRIHEITEALATKCKD